jgi:hypothetical protein
MCPFSKIGAVSSFSATLLSYFLLTGPAVYSRERVSGKKLFNRDELYPRLLSLKLGIKSSPRVHSDSSRDTTVCPRLLSL